MSTSSVPPISGDDAPIDAEFEPAPSEKPKSSRSFGRPGWIAFGMLGLVSLLSLTLALASIGRVPGFTPDAGRIAALQTDLSAVSEAQAQTKARAFSIATDVTDLRTRTDNLQADRTRALTDIRALQSEIETLQADISTLQRVRLASLAEDADADESAPIVDLSNLETRMTTLEDALVTKLSDYEATLEGFRMRLSDLEGKAEAETLTAAVSTNARTEAALALSAIEAAARRGRPFLTAHARLLSALPENEAVQGLEPIAAQAVPTLSDLQTQFPALRDEALDLEAEQKGGGSSWMRTIFGDGVQVRVKDEATSQDQLEQASSALQSGDLPEAIARIEALSTDLQPVFTEWLDNAATRHQLEESLEALRLTMIAEERP
ncbi:MAG: hypothetical protein AAGL90_01010 [Pseudomonadota bacterium]